MIMNNYSDSGESGRETADDTFVDIEIESTLRHGDDITLPRDVRDAHFDDSTDEEENPQV